MNEKQTEDNPIRPTKKQSDLLEFIETFIEEHGYSPSYREIMAGCNYTSVATVALHVSSLIKRGHLVKRGRSARSLEVVDNSKNTQETQGQPDKAGQDWLVAKVEQMLDAASQAPSEEQLSRIAVVVGAMGILGMNAAELEFGNRLEALRKIE